MPTLKCPVTNCKYVTDDLCITAVSALLTAHSVEHTINSQPASKPEQAKRPTISLKISSEDFSFFEHLWGQYKCATRLSGRDLSRELLECCDIQLRRAIYRIHNDISGLSESEILKHIKDIAIINENLTVSRRNLIAAKQRHDEPIREFEARLRGLASMCKLTMHNKCSEEHDVTFDFSDTMITFVIIQNIYDSEIQSAILSHTNQNLSLQELITFIEAKEAGKKFSASLAETPATNAIKSTYKTNTYQPNSQPQYPKPMGAPQTPNNRYRPSFVRPDFRGQNSGQNIRNPAPRQQFSPSPRSPMPAGNRCTWCGNTDHGNDHRVSVRQVACPAFNKACNKCGFLHHFPHMCIRSKRNNYPRTLAVESTTENFPSEYDNQDATEHLGALSISDSS